MIITPNTKVETLVHSTAENSSTENLLLPLELTDAIWSVMLARGLFVKIGGRWYGLLITQLIAANYDIVWISSANSGFHAFDWIWDMQKEFV